MSKECATNDPASRVEAGRANEEQWAAPSLSLSASHCCPSATFDASSCLLATRYVPPLPDMARGVNERRGQRGAAGGGGGGSGAARRDGEEDSTPSAVCSSLVDVQNCNATNLNAKGAVPTLVDNARRQMKQRRSVSPQPACVRVDERRVALRCGGAALAVMANSDDRARVSPHSSSSSRHSECSRQPAAQPCPAECRRSLVNRRVGEQQRTITKRNRRRPDDVKTKTKKINKHNSKGEENMSNRFRIAIDDESSRGEMR